MAQVFKEPVQENIEIDIGVDTSELDNALDKCEELSEVTGDFSPQVSIRNCKGCTFNIYPTRNIFYEAKGE